MSTLVVLSLQELWNSCKWYDFLHNANSNTTCACIGTESQNRYIQDDRWVEIVHWNLNQLPKPFHQALLAGS
jgi:hypothetical protein